MLAAQERVGLDDRVRRQLVEPQQQRAAGGRLRGAALVLLARGGGGDGSVLGEAARSAVLYARLVLYARGGSCRKAPNRASSAAASPRARPRRRRRRGRAASQSSAVGSVVPHCAAPAAPPRRCRCTPRAARRARRAAAPPRPRTPHAVYSAGAPQRGYAVRGGGGRRERRVAGPAAAARLVALVRCSEAVRSAGSRSSFDARELEVRLREEAERGGRYVGGRRSPVTWKSRGWIDGKRLAYRESSSPTAAPACAAASVTGVKKRSSLRSGGTTSGCCAR